MRKRRMRFRQVIDMDATHKHTKIRRGPVSSLVLRGADYLQRMFFPWVHG